MIIFDNFLEDYEFRREHALSGEFRDVPQPVGVFPGINESAISDFPYARLRTAYRLTLKDSVLPTFIHNDLDMGRKSAILYLSDGTGGTAFWKHKETQWDNAYPLLDPNCEPGLAITLAKKFQTEGLDESKWDQIGLIEHKPNRLVLFDAGLWHSPWPREGWGTSPEDGRLIQITFFA